jgi:hypothetical protein
MSVGRHIVLSSGDDSLIHISLFINRKEKQVAVLASCSVVGYYKIIVKGSEQVSLLMVVPETTLNVTPSNVLTPAVYCNSEVLDL